MCNVFDLLSQKNHAAGHRVNSFALNNIYVGCPLHVLIQRVAEAIFCLLRGVFNFSRIEMSLVAFH